MELSQAEFTRKLEVARAAALQSSFGAELLCRRNPKQLAAICSAAPRKVLCCGRRGGKSFAVVVALLQTARDTGRPCLYLTLTRENAKDIVWGDLCALNAAYHLGFVTNASELSLTHPNGGSIRLRGADSIDAVEKVRGKKYALVILDEMQSFHDRILIPLIEQGIGATLTDFDGSFWKVGTPSAVHRGYWWECYAGRMAGSAEQHAWTLRNNAELPVVAEGRLTADQVLQKVLDEYGWTEDNPTFQVEYLGNRDIQTTEGLLYPHGEANYFEALPAGSWTYVFGIDVGARDSDAIAVLGWPKHGKAVYLVDEHVAKSGSDVSDLREALEPLYERYKPVRMVLDQGGGGLKVANEARKRWGVPVVGAQKHDKGAYIRLMQGALNKQELLVKRSSRWADDARQVRLDLDQLARGVLAEDRRGYHSDITDAVLYAWRECRAYRETEAPPPPPTTVQREQRDLERALRAPPKPWHGLVKGKASRLFE